jgi:hypothetical protein
MTETEKSLTLEMPKKGDKLFRPLGRQRGAILVHPGGVTDPEGNRDITTRRYLYEEGYKRGAGLLLSAAECNPMADALLYPIVFLYRQYLELKLKSLLNCAWEVGLEASGKVDHDLRSLWKTLRGSVLPTVWPEVPPSRTEAVEKCVDELHSHDPASLAFRYPENKQGDAQTLESLQSVDLANLRDVMGRIANFLDCADEAIGRWTEDGAGTE